MRVKIEHANWSATNKLAVAHKNKFAVYISNGLDLLDDESPDDKIWRFVTDELIKFLGNREAAYYDNIHNLIDGGLFFFDTEKAARNFYSIFTQELTDSSAIYAELYDPTGECITENT